MAVFAPGDSPPDDGSGAGVDPGMWARLMGYINPIGSANAAPAPAAAPGGRFQGPGTQAQSGGYPVNAAGQPQYAVGPINQAMQSGAGNTNTPAILPHLTGDGPNVQGRPVLPYLNPNTRDLSAAAAIPTNLPPQAAAARPGGIGSDANFPVMGAGGFPTTYAAPGQQPAGPGGPGPLIAHQPSIHPVVARGGGGGAAIDPRMRGQVPAAAAPPAGWGVIDRPNANPGTGGGMLGAGNQGPRGNGGAPSMGAFNFASLFGGQPAAAPAAAAPSALPRQKIKVKIPASATAEVPPVTSNAPSNYGPLQQGWNFGWGGTGNVPT